MESPITHEVIVGEELIQIKNVPALVCRDCGEEWIEQEVKDTIERIIKEGVAEESD